MRPWKALEGRFERGTAKAQAKVDRATKKADAVKAQSRAISRCIRKSMALAQERIELGLVNFIQGKEENCMATVDALVGQKWMEKDTTKPIPTLVATIPTETAPTPLV